MAKDGDACVCAHCGLVIKYGVSPQSQYWYHVSTQTTYCYPPKVATPSHTGDNHTNDANYL